MCAQEKAKKYVEEHFTYSKELAYNCYMNAYTEGYADGIAIEQIPSDKMINRIIALSNNFDRYDAEKYSVNKKIEYIKNALYNS